MAGQQLGILMVFSDWFASSEGVAVRTLVTA
jgi:hypothetical protein